MIQNEVVVISMTKQDLDKYIKKFYQNSQKESRPEIGEKLNQKQAAALFGVTTATIIRWQKKEIIPVNKVGRTVFYYKSELLAIAKSKALLLK